MRPSRHSVAHVLHAYRSALVFERQMRVMVQKELLQLWRDRPLLLFIAYIFTVNIIMAGGETRELRNARVLVYDADHSFASRDLVYRFRKPYFVNAGEVTNAKEGMRRLDRGEAIGFLDIPEKFEETLRRGGKTAKVQLHVDTSASIRGYLAASYSALITAQFTRDWAAHNMRGPGGQAQSVPSISNEDRVWFNADLNESWFHSIAELLTMMSVACILLPASALVREKERGTIEQLLVSPLSPFRILLPKVIAMTLVMLIGTAIAVFGIMGPVFHVPIRGSILLLLLFTTIFSVTTAGLGIVAGTFARNSGQVGMLVLLVVMPIIVLSGTWTPQESLPQTIRFMTNLSPLRHYIPIAYGILLRGEGIDTLWKPALAMIVLGTGLFAVAMARFRRQFH